MANRRQRPCDTCGGPSRRGHCMSCYRASRPTPEQRFWEGVDTSGGLLACWPWAGPRHQRGYGVFASGRRSTSIRAHRFALELKLGRPLGPGMGACHHCDNPPCGNPAHLFEGTQHDNLRDASAKGRTAFQRRPERRYNGPVRPLETTHV